MRKILNLSFIFAAVSALAQQSAGMLTAQGVGSQNGINLTNLNASSLASGTVPLAQLPAINPTNVMDTSSAPGTLSICTNVFGWGSSVAYSGPVTNLTRYQVSVTLGSSGRGNGGTSLSPYAVTNVFPANFQRVPHCDIVPYNSYAIQAEYNGGVWGVSSCTTSNLTFGCWTISSSGFAASGSVLTFDIYLMP